VKKLRAEVVKLLGLPESLRYVFHSQSSGDAEDRFGLPVTAARPGPNWSQGVRERIGTPQKEHSIKRRTIVRRAVAIDRKPMLLRPLPDDAVIRLPQTDCLDVHRARK
jgi:hypothetical protein